MPAWISIKYPLVNPEILEIDKTLIKNKKPLT
jgi:hypothetical protein